MHAADRLVVASQSNETPELVLEQEATLDAAGEAVIEIDSSLAKAFQVISTIAIAFEVDVRDASRRTCNRRRSHRCSTTLQDLCWCHRGFYQSGDKIVANFQARTSAGKPVKAQGRLELLRITYDSKREPIETPVEGWDVSTDAEGNLEHTMQAGRGGQYRLRLVLTDNANHTIEGGHIITIRGNGPQANEFDSARSRSSPIGANIRSARQPSFRLTPTGMMPWFGCSFVPRIAFTLRLELSNYKLNRR